MLDTNPFYQSAMALWKRGEDGEVIARELAEAFTAIVEEGKGKGYCVEAERQRLLGPTAGPKEG